MPKILVIDDNVSVCEAIELLFSLHDIDTDSAQSPQEGLDMLAGDHFDLVIQDMNFSADTTSGEEGAQLFRDIRQAQPDLPVILLTAWTNLEMAVGLVKSGAADYLSKPWDDAKLVATVRNLLQLGGLARENRKLHHQRQTRRDKLAREFDLGGLIYDSDAMQELASLAARVARSDLPVLITGPNGAGKELIADIVQRNSAVSDAAYVKVNAGALPSELMEAELFGAEAGAYTGANKAREGRFEAADGGTLFLDEIGNLPLAGQVKLLRVLQTGEFDRLGSTRTRKARVRLISATNADLPALMREGRFREDLYYRLNVIELRVPALCERPEDALLIARSMLPAGRGFSSEAEDAILAYQWPGNVRELRNHVQRALLLAAGDLIGVRDLDLPSPKREAAEPDAKEIETALKKHNGVIANAARELGLSRQALYRRMEKFGLKDSSGAGA
ncbi:sigma-54-dependent Fis family transcriptional regulator [Proteobacteria bacterium 005FR1]|nr:sigma-54-dependent Fis family transcriptional regulator [Proteobacteria bacterium 005FR1]